MINYNELINKITTGKMEKRESTASKDFLKIDIFGNTIIGRFLPDFKTIVATNNFEAKPWMYYHHGWTSKQDSLTNVFCVCPNTYNEKCPICKQSVAMWKSSDPVQKKLSERIRRRQTMLVNFYVINNPANPDDNGKVKILRFGKQINNKYVLATEGDDKVFFGDRIWKLTAEGCSFRIKCEKNVTNFSASSTRSGGEAWPDYNNSGFLPAGPIDGMTDDKINVIMNSVFELPKMYPRTSQQDAQKLLDQHFNCNDIALVGAPITTASEPVAKMPSATPTPEARTETEAFNNQNADSEDAIDKMLAELQNTL